MKDWFVSWYFGAVIANDRCPCAWPIKSKRLMHLCGRLDDAYDRIEMRRSFAFIMALPFPLTQNTSSTSSNVTVTWTQPPRKHGGQS